MRQGIVIATPRYGRGHLLTLERRAGAGTGAWNFSQTWVVEIAVGNPLEIEVGIGKNDASAGSIRTRFPGHELLFQRVGSMMNHISSVQAGSDTILWRANHPE